MFENLAYFSSFIESIIALSFFLGAWKKPEEVFSNLLEKSFSNEKILLSETRFLIDTISGVFNHILRLARWISIPTILYGLIILFLSGNCDYDNSQSICEYSIGTNNQSIVIHLLIVSLPILLNLSAFVFGILYYVVTFILIWMVVITTRMLDIWTVIKEKKEKLSILMELSTKDLEELIKNKNEP